MSDHTAAAAPKSVPDYGRSRPKVPAFARYEGTSAWRKDRRRVRAYALHLAAADRKRGDRAAPGA